MIYNANLAEETHLKNQIKMFEEDTIFIDRINDIDYDEIDDFDKETIVSTFNDYIDYQNLTCFKRKGIQLVYPDYDETMPENYINYYLQGDTDGIEEEILYRWYYHTREQATDELIKETLSKMGLDQNENADFVYELLYNYFKESIQEIEDTQSIIDTLIHNTGEILLRKTLSPQNHMDLWKNHPDAQKSVYLDDESLPARVKAIEEYLLKTGTLAEISEENHDQIVEMVENGPEWLHEGVTLDLFWYGDPTEVILDPEHTSRNVTTHSDITLLLIDRINGSGFEATLKNISLTTTITKDSPAFTDHDNDYGYSWDEVAGVVPTPYKATFYTNV